MALRSDNLKRRLAYSTVSQLSYVVLAAALLAPLSIVGAALHIAAHAVGKITLFFAAGAIYTAAHKTQVSELDGIGRRMPWTMGAFALGALSMIGLPPAAGFVSKWYILSGRPRHRAVGRARGDRREHAPERRLFRCRSSTARFLRATGRAARARARRSAAGRWSSRSS